MKLKPIALLFSAMLFSSSSSAAKPLIFKQEDVQKRYIVVYKNATHSQNSLKGELLNNNVDKVQQIQNIGGNVIKKLSAINGLAVHLTKSQKQTLESQSDIDYIEEDPIRYLAKGSNATWGGDMVQAPTVTDSFSGNRKICIIDTGYDITHSDLPSGGNITGEVSNTLTEDYSLNGWHVDSYGHGTHIAGTMVALANSTGFDGILPGGHVNLHIVKVIHNPHYWTIWGSDMIAGIQACQNAGANVVNMSIAGPKPSAAEQTAMQNAYDSGMLLVAAAGNRGNGNYYYPASYDSVISVGAVDRDKNAWMFTQKNDQVEFVAPGVAVRSTLPGNRYSTWDGTSVATPHVSGVAALVWSHYPECSNTQIRNILQYATDDLGDSDRDDTYGYGLIRADYALWDLNDFGCEG